MAARKRAKGRTSRRGIRGPRNPSPCKGRSSHQTSENSYSIKKNVSGSKFRLGGANSIDSQGISDDSITNEMSAPTLLRLVRRFRTLVFHCSKKGGFDAVFCSQVIHH